MLDQSMDAPQNAMASDAYLRQLKATFEQLPNDINLYLFTAKGHEDAFTHANREIIRAFRELSDKITLREYDLDHELAGKSPKARGGGKHPGGSGERDRHCRHIFGPSRYRDTKVLGKPRSFRQGFQAEGLYHFRSRQVRLHD